MRARRVAVVVALSALASGSACTCTKLSSTEDAATSSAPGAVAPVASVGAPGSARFSAPIAAARMGDTGDVLVVGLDVTSKAIRLQRISAQDQTKTDRTILEDVAWTSDADLKVFGGATNAVVWRGKHAGKAGRTLVTLGQDLAPLPKPETVGATSCATHDAFVHADGKAIARLGFATTDAAAARSSVDVPKDREVALACAAHRAFVVLEHDDGADLGLLEGAALHTKPLLRDAELDGEARERAEYVVGDELGVVRLAQSGSLTWRETKDGRPGPLRKLTTKIPQDDDVVALDASPRVVVVVYTQEVEGGCPGTSPSTKVLALRIDRATAAESVLELAPGMCGREIGPFYTSAAGDAVNVAWVERVPTAGQARPPIAALAHAAVLPDAPPHPLARIDVDADALADAGCDATHCWAAALVRSPGMDAMVPGPIRVLRYAP